MSEIRFEGVAKRFGANEVVSGLDLVVREGELMVLVGPSGCAKSTTLRMIAGLESVSTGDLFIGGERANRLAPGERNIAMVFQSYALFPNMTVRGNLSFGMKTRGERREHIAREVDRVAGMLGLGDLLDRGRVHSVEALLRWDHPTFGEISPNETVDAAIACNRFDALNRWVLRSATTWVHEARRRSGRDLSVSVNVSGEELSSPAMLGSLAAAVEHADLEPRHLAIEIGERAGGAIAAPAEENMRALRAMGFRLILDDFGEGAAPSPPCSISRSTPSSSIVASSSMPLAPRPTGPCSTRSSNSAAGSDGPSSPKGSRRPNTSRS